MTTGALQTCHRWYNILLDIPLSRWGAVVNDMADRASTPLDIQQIPASFHALLTIENRIRVPNVLIAGTDWITARGYKRTISWDSIALHATEVVGTRSFAQYVLSCPYTYNEAFFYYMFATYEQYRRHILANIHGTSWYCNTDYFTGISPIDFAKQLWPYRNQRKMSNDILTNMRVIGAAMSVCD